jgi:hypothetical protein
MHPGEGFFQEVGEAYEQTNKRKDADIQVRFQSESQFCCSMMTADGENR